MEVVFAIILELRENYRQYVLIFGNSIQHIFDASRLWNRWKEYYDS